LSDEPKTRGEVKHREKMMWLNGVSPVSCYNCGYTVYASFEAGPEKNYNVPKVCPKCGAK